MCLLACHCVRAFFWDLNDVTLTEKDSNLVDVHIVDIIDVDVDADVDDEVDINFLLSLMLMLMLKFKVVVLEIKLHQDFKFECHMNKRKILQNVKHILFQARDYMYLAIEFVKRLSPEWRLLSF